MVLLKGHQDQQFRGSRVPWLLGEHLAVLCGGPGEVTSTVQQPPKVKGEARIIGGQRSSAAQVDQRVGGPCAERTAEVRLGEGACDCRVVHDWLPRIDRRVESARLKGVLSNLAGAEAP